MKVRKLVLPDSIKFIGDNSFKNSSNLAKVSIGGEIFTLVTDVINRLKNKGVSVFATAFKGISKIHSAHSFSYTITKAATCTESGSKTGTCGCGDTDTQSISATGHSYGSWVTSSNGTTKSRTCSNCGNKETVSNTVDLKNASADIKAKYNFLGTTNIVNKGSTSLGSTGTGDAIYGYYTELGSTGTSRFNSNNYTCAECIIYLSKSNTICNITYPAGYYKLNKLSGNWWINTGGSRNYLHVWTGTTDVEYRAAGPEYTYLGSTYSVVNAV